MDLQIGDHCHFCNRLDLLPFQCLDCHHLFCLNHRSPLTHACSAKAARKEKSQTVPKTQESYLTCKEDGCPAKLSDSGDIGTKPGVVCPQCQGLYCLRHRLQHKCLLEPSTDGKKKKLDKSKLSILTKHFSRPRIFKRNPPSQAAERSNLRRNAKGDSNIAMEERIYLNVEAAENGKTEHRELFFSRGWPVGKVLDHCAHELGIVNVNHKHDRNEERLRVYHVEGGQVLSFGESLGQTGVKNCDTIAIIRGLYMQ